MTEIPFLTPGVDDAAPGLMQRATAILPLVRPAMKYVPKNPLFLIAAVVLGVAGVMAWRNRERIAATARPLLQNAAARGAEFRDQAMAKGAEFRDQAVAKGAELRERLPGGQAKPEPAESGFH